MGGFAHLARGALVGSLTVAAHDARLPERHRAAARAVLWTNRPGDRLAKRADDGLVLGGLRVLASMILDPELPPETRRRAREEARADAQLLGLRLTDGLLRRLADEAAALAGR